MNRRKWGEFRRWLPANHPYRRDHAFGKHELRAAPALRTHAGYIADGIANATYVGPANASPHKESGVSNVSPLVDMPLFNLAWDVLADVMHTVPRFWRGHMFPLLRGLRYPAQPKTRKSWNDKDNRKLLDDNAKLKAQMKKWKVDKVHSPYVYLYSHICTYVHLLTCLVHPCAPVPMFNAPMCAYVQKYGQDVLDSRSLALAGDSSWIRSNIEVYSHSGTMTAHDWIQIITKAGDYIMHDIFGVRLCALMCTYI